MSIKMELTRKALRVKKEFNKKIFAGELTSIHQALSINETRDAPYIIKKIAFSNLKIQKQTIANVNVFSINPKKTKYFANTTMLNDYCLLYIHGGGFVSGFALQSAYFIKSFIKQTGIKALAVDYSLSPEVVFPTALNQIYDVYLQLIKTYKPKNIVLMGESAGANLALSLMLKLRNSKKPLPKMGILASGYFDLTNSGKSYYLNAESDPLLIPPQTALMATAYVAGNCILPLAKEELVNPYISPIFANLKGLPPLFISACEDELLFSDSETIYNNCLRDNVKCKFNITKNCFHAHLILGDFFAESKAVTEDCCNYVKQILKI